MRRGVGPWTTDMFIEAMYAEYREDTMTLQSRRQVSAAALAAALVGRAVLLAAQSAPREQAPLDVIGYWVSIVTEDWHERMMTPRHGDYASLPLNDAGKRAADAWDPAKTTPVEACKPFGAAAIMRVPGRVHLTWESPSILRIETDAGLQTRRLVFDGSAGRWRTSARGELVWEEGRSAVRASARPRDWQGQSGARWDIAPDPAAVRTSLFFPAASEPDPTAPDWSRRAASARSTWRPRGSRPATCGATACRPATRRA